ncbi:MAG: lysylphosphatidylglycerol synthase transmembrane domain-containing protein, partial [Ginsengibacter sp.]
VLKYVLLLGLGISLVWWQFHKMTDVQRLQFSESLKEANYWLIVPIIVMCVLSHVSRAMRWKILIEPLGYHPSTSNAFYAVMSGYVANTFLPRAGEVLKCSLLTKYENIPLNKLLGTILIERAFDLVCYFILIVITILVQVKNVSAFVKEKFNGIKTGNSINLAIVLLLTVLAMIFAVMLIRWLLKKFKEVGFIKSINKFFLGLREGLHTIRFLKRKNWFIGHTIFIWLMYLLQIYVGFSALAATSHLGIVEAASVLSLATLGMIISPGGIGAFPFAVQEVLLIYNVDNVSFGWLIWGVSTGIIIIVGIISFMILVLKNRKEHEVKAAAVIQNL